MVYLAKTILSGRQKMLYALVAGLALAMPAAVLYFAETILAFLLAGAVPGTDIVIPPDVVLWSVTSVLTLSTAGFVWRKARSARHRRMHIPVIIHDDRDTRPAMQMVSDGAVQRTRIRAGFGIRAVGRHISGFMHAAAVRLKEAAEKLSSWLASAGRTILTSLQVILTVIYNTMRLLAVGLVRGSILLARGLGAQSVRFWRWATPRLRKFDAWLELQVRKVEKWYGRTSARSDR